MSEIVIFGGYGVFGSLVARELAQQSHTVVIAGRDHAKAEALAASLGAKHRAVAADVTDAATCRDALRGCCVAVHCAGPFQRQNATLLEASLAAGCHYVDISDDRNYARLVRAHSKSFAARRLAAVYGCSSLPAVSGALALLLADPQRQPERARVTLFIGNNNPKGDAAVHSLLGGLGRPITAPQGLLRGFRQGAIVSLPASFGRRATFSFDSPEYDLLPPLLGVRSMAVKVGFELRPVTYGLAALSLLAPGVALRFARVLLLAGKLTSGLGSTGGVVMTELYYANGGPRRAALVARADGQRMAALPAVIVAGALAGGTVLSGAQTAYEALGPRSLLQALVSAGFELHLTG